MSILVAGHYCHDTVHGNDGAVHRALGGSAAYAGAILSALRVPFTIAAKVGEDFLYAGEVPRPARVVTGARTTSFIDDYRFGERREHVEAVCAPLYPDDLRGNYEVSIACAVAGEVLPETLARLRSISRVVLADAQGLLREVSAQGEVRLRPLHPDAAGQVDVLKASVAEARLLDLAALRGRLTVIVTDGPRGCTILRGASEEHVAAAPAEERDPTGAGDCFLAGLAAGLLLGRDLRAAARLGAYCGARAVEQVGVPRLTAAQVAAALGA